MDHAERLFDESGPARFFVENASRSQVRWLEIVNCEQLHTKSDYVGSA